MRVDTLERRRSLYDDAVAVEVRMRNAAGLLADGSLRVREVANRVGYRQPAQFAKAFRRHYGTAPSRLRQAALAA